MFDWVNVSSFSPAFALVRLYNELKSGKTVEDNNFSEWLYSEWDEQKYNDYKIYNMIPGISHYMNYLLDLRSDEEYMRRYQLDWTDIHDPRKLSQTSSSARLFDYAYRQFSDNYKKLYK